MAERTNEREDTTPQGTGISNRPIDEEAENPQALPERGGSKGEDPDRTSDSDRGSDR